MPKSRSLTASSFKAEQTRAHFAVDRVGGAGKGGRAERAAVDAAAQVGHAFAVALEHFDVGKQVMPEGDGLGDLHVRKARHQGVGFLGGLSHEHLLQVAEHADDFVDLGAQVKADVGGNLVVAAAAGVQALARVADELREACFDVEVNVLEFELPKEFFGFDLVGDLGHAAADVGEVLLGDDAAGGEHLSVCKRAGDIGGGHALVKAHRLGISEHELGNGFGKAARPGFLLGMQGIGRVIVRVCHGKLVLWLKIKPEKRNGESPAALLPEEARESATWFCEKRQ